MLMVAMIKRLEFMSISFSVTIEPRIASSLEIGNINSESSPDYQWIFYYRNFCKFERRRMLMIREQNICQSIN